MIYYQNTAGKKVQLDAPPYAVDITELTAFGWTYDTSLYSIRYGGRVSGFTMGVEERSLTVGVCGTPAAMKEALDRILSVTQYDIQAEEPGRLYVGNQYLLCNMVAGSVQTFFDPDIEYVEKSYTLVLSYPFWCTETTSHYEIASGIPTEEGLDYPYDYGYDYLADINAGKQLINDHYAPCDFTMTVFGPALNPQVTIAGHIYGITATLYDDEYLIINSREAKIYKVATDGSETNLFNQRNKGSDIFEKIPGGTSTVIYNGEFGFDITLYQERSEPSWTTS